MFGRKKLPGKLDVFIHFLNNKYWKICPEHFHDFSYAKFDMKFPLNLGKCEKFADNSRKKKNLRSEGSSILNFLLILCSLKEHNT